MTSLERCIKRIDGPAYQIRVGSPRCRLTLSANKWPHSEEVVERLGLFSRAEWSRGGDGDIRQMGRWKHSSETGVPE